MFYRSSRGFTFLEILAVTAVTALIAFPVMLTIFTSGHEAMVSEDYMLAEELCQRYIQEVLATPQAELQLPYDLEIRGLPPGDQEIAANYMEYVRNLLGEESFRGRLSVRSIEEGLFCIEVVLRWPVKPGSSQYRHYSMVRYKSNSDCSIRKCYRLKAPRAVQHIGVDI